jgi:phosphoribosylglycinamide formyltransferase-1
MKIPIAIFASGKGSNAQALIEFSHKEIALFEVKLVVTNKQDAGVRHICHQFGIPCFYWKNNDPGLPGFLIKNNIGLVVLAGYLAKIGDDLLRQYPGKILNIHPALLPAYGGKGMYGMNVHKAVLQAGEKESGISIHLVDEEYDHGRVLFQASTPVLPEDTAESLAARIHGLEHTHYPSEVNKFIMEFSG